MNSIGLLDSSSHKSMIIDIVVQHPNSKAKHIHSLLKKTHGISYSYQATFKLLSEMVRKNMLEKNGLTYHINKHWLIEQKLMIEGLLHHTMGQSGQTLYTSPSMTVARFECLRDMELFWTSRIIALAKKLKEKSLYWKNPHAWWLLGAPMEEESTIHEMDTTGIKDNYGWITSDSKLDYIAQDYFVNRKRTVAIKKEKNNEVVEVIGPYVLISEIPKKLLDMLNKFYSASDEHYDLDKIMRIILHPAVIELKIIRNKELAKTYREQILAANTKTLTH
jgi:hypothetical protein